MNWHVKAFQKYALFNGRSRRNEYWYFILINAMVILGIILLKLSFGTHGILGAIYAFGTIVPALAITVRRLHDTGRNGWTLLLALLPVIGGIILLIFLLHNRQYGNNKYGKWPKERLEFR